MHYLSLTELGARLRRREISSLEATNAMLERIARLDGVLNAYVTVLAEDARAQARKADEELARGFDRGPLHGVPIAVKDLLYTANAPTSAGSAFLGEINPRWNATVVERLNDAGAVLLGKLATTEGALAEYPPGRTPPANPWNGEYWTGISSSGSGVATASGLCYAALGTDTGGSIRFPSAACALTGLKPTWGRVSRHGLFPMCESRDTIGPMARSAADAAAMLGAIAGRDAHDPTSLPESPENYLARLSGGLGGARIGLDRGELAADTDPVILAALEQAAKTLEQRGARLHDVRFPSPRVYMSTYFVQTASSLAAVHAPYFPAYADRYGAVLRRVVEAGFDIKGSDVVKADFERLRFAGALANLFEDIDILLLPVFPTKLPTAKEMATLADPGAFARTRGLYALPLSATGHPSLTLPCGFGDDDVPIGMQMVGRPLNEALLLRAGHAYQQMTAFHARHPALD